MRTNAGIGRNENSRVLESSGRLQAAVFLMDPLTTIFDNRFHQIHQRSSKLIGTVNEIHLYERPRQLINSMAPFSIGEFVLRSAAMVEKAFGGITTRLWDDPFEWTLPEKLSSVRSVLDYLDEVEETRARGFRF